MMLHDADRHGIDQRIACIALFKINFTADCRDAERVAVIAYAAHDAIDQIADMGILRRAEPERVERCHRTGTHGENIAVNTANPCSCALIGLDG